MLGFEPFNGAFELADFLLGSFEFVSSVLKCFFDSVCVKGIAGDAITVGFEFFDLGSALIDLFLLLFCLVDLLLPGLLFFPLFALGVFFLFSNLVSFANEIVVVFDLLFDGCALVFERLDGAVGVVELTIQCLNIF